MKIEQSHKYEKVPCMMDSVVSDIVVEDMMDTNSKLRMMMTVCWSIMTNPDRKHHTFNIASINTQKSENVRVPVSNEFENPGSSSVKSSQKDLYQQKVWSLGGKMVKTP